MTAGKKMNWCERCHHAIIPGTGPGVGWVHFSDDDWSGPCRCVSGIVACRPESRRRRQAPFTWPTPGQYTLEPFFWGSPGPDG